jgi:glyoxylase-like metal-dependent hydrolase (beta-lactamase superfamily II)
VEGGYPKNDTGDTVPEDRVVWLDYRDWNPIGPFARSHDFFGDGSLYIIDASGHMPGHINVLTRIDASGKWAYLAGDSAHDIRLITGEREIGHYHDSEGTLCCMHEDEDMAKDHIQRIRSLPENVTIWIAHDPLRRERDIGS